LHLQHSRVLSPLAVDMTRLNLYRANMVKIHSRQVLFMRRHLTLTAILRLRRAFWLKMDIQLAAMGV